MTKAGMFETRAECMKRELCHSCCDLSWGGRERSERRPERSCLKGQSTSGCVLPPKPTQWAQTREANFWVSKKRDLATHTKKGYFVVPPALHRRFARPCTVFFYQVGVVHINATRACKDGWPDPIYAVHQCALDCTCHHHKRYHVSRVILPLFKLFHHSQTYRHSQQHCSHNICKCVLTLVSTDSVVHSSRSFCMDTEQHPLWQECVPTCSVCPRTSLQSVVPLLTDTR